LAWPPDELRAAQLARVSVIGAAALVEPGADIVDRAAVAPQRIAHGRPRFG